MSNRTVVTLGEVADVIPSNVDKIIHSNEQSIRLCNYMDAYSNRYLDKKIKYNVGSATNAEILKFTLKIDDVVITKDSETPEDIAVPSVIIENLSNVICGYHLALLRPKANILSGQYLMHLLQDNIVKKQFTNKANGSTRYGLTIDSIKGVKLELPNYPIQQKIAKILSTIDGQIEKTEAIIDKYQAVKQGMLQDLFTRGIDVTTGELRPKYEDAPQLYKDSQLGMMPKDWEVVCLGQICEMKSGDGITSESISEVGEYPVYGGNGLRGYTSQCTHEGYYVLIGRQGALCGNITKARGKFFASEHAVVVTLFEQMNTDWLAEKLETMTLNKYSEASAQPGLSVSKILKLQITKPPHEEQKDISTKVMQVICKLQIEEKNLNKLKFIKQGLMSDLLSGKVEVKA